MIRAPRSWAAAQRLGDLRLDGAVGQRGAVVDAGDDHRVGGVEQLQTVVGQHLEAGGAAHRPPARGAHPHVVEGRLVGGPGGAEDLGGGAEVEADHVVQGEYGDPVRATVMARLLRMMAFRPLVVAVRPRPDWCA